MSYAEQVGEYAVRNGIRALTRPCWRCVNQKEACPKCGATGEIVPCWNDEHVQLFVLSGILGAMRELKSAEQYDRAWDLLDWVIGYIGRCFQQGVEEMGSEKMTEAVADMAAKMDTKLPEPPQAKVSGDALSSEELEELLG